MRVETTGTTRPTEIPGLNGIEKLDTIPVLKSGSFREFLNKVMEIRQDPAKEKQTHDEIKKIDSDTTLSDDDKKAKLRAIDRVKLFAIIGKNIDFGETGLEITFDFGDLAFAEERAIGAGDMLPPNVQKITKKADAESTQGTRSIGPNGREYQSEEQNYIASYTGTKLSIDYKDILTTNSAQAQQMEATEKKGEAKAEKVEDTSKAEAKALKEDVSKKPQVPPPIPPRVPEPEKKEVGVSHRPVIIGDSQAQGIGLSKEMRDNGIFAAGFVGKRIEYIAKKIDNKKNTELRNNIASSDSIILQCGGNNIVQGYSLKDMQDALRTLIKAVRTLNESAPIYVGLLMPPTNKPINLVTRLAYNEWLKAEASKGTFRIIDSYGAVADKNNPKQRDGAFVNSQSALHLNLEGYEHLAKIALKTINYQKV